MTLYIAFTGYHYYPEGGMEDAKYIGSSLDEAKAAVLSEFDGAERWEDVGTKWGQVYDVETRTLWHVTFGAMSRRGLPGGTEFPVVSWLEESVQL